MSDQDARQYHRCHLLFQEFLTHQMSLHHAYAIEQQMRSVLSHKVQYAPSLKRIFAVQCPNMLSEKGQDSIIYYWAKRVERPSMTSEKHKEAEFEKKGRRRSRAVAYGTWVPPGSWNTTVSYWRYKWRRFRYLPVPNNRIKRTKRQKEKEFFIEIRGSQQIIKDKNNKIF